MAERLLITTRNQILIWDGDTQCVWEKCVQNSFHNFYGATWDTENIYVTERVNQRRGIIHVFDKEFNRTGQLPLNPHAPHQMYWWDGILYITDCSQGDRLLLWDGSDARIVQWQRPDGHRLHTNSIWCDGERFYALEHRGTKVPKWVRVLDLSFNSIDHIALTREMFPQRKRVLHGAHNVYAEDGTLYVYDPTAILQYDLTSKNCRAIVPHQLMNTRYARGLARVPGKFFIGLSEARRRSERWKGDALVLVTDDDFNTLDVLSLENTGSLQEIRAIDGPDLAHNRIRCPWVS